MSKVQAGKLMPALQGVFVGTLLAYAATGQAQELDFDAPEVEERTESALPTSVGPFSNVSIGGAIDWRLMYERGQMRPMSFVHVNELVVSANVGPHISISAEHLLITSELDTVVAQDHGFVVMNLVQLPFLPTGTNIKLGRFRGKFGLDAQSDSPANIFPSQALRSNGMVTDLGVGVDYFAGPIEFLVEAFNGPDYVLENGQRAPIMVDKLPVQARFVYQPISQIKLGLSGFIGETWSNQVSPQALGMGMLGASLDQSRIIERRRLAVDASYRTPFVDLYAEGIWGIDKGRLSQPIDKSSTLARGALVRTDIPLFRVSEDARARLAVQYDTWEDASYAGRVGFVSSAFSIIHNDGWTYRFGGSLNDSLFVSEKPESLHKAPWTLSTQLLASF